MNLNKFYIFTFFLPVFDTITTLIFLKLGGIEINFIPRTMYENLGVLGILISSVFNIFLFIVVVDLPVITTCFDNSLSSQHLKYIRIIRDVAILEMVFIFLAVVVGNVFYILKLMK